MGSCDIHSQSAVIVEQLDRQSRCPISCGHLVPILALMFVLFPWGAVRCANAGGIIRGLPEDGAWARFDVQLEIVTAKGDRVPSGSSSFTIRSVGREMVDDAPCRWIELVTSQKLNDGAARADLFKILVPEKHFTEDDNPLDHAVRAWSRRGNTVATSKLVEIDKFTRNHKPLDPLFYGKLDQLTEVDPMTIETPLGKYRCSGIIGTRNVPSNVSGESTNYRHDTREEMSVPFGVVEYRVESEKLRAGKPVGPKQVLTYKLVEMGMGSKSEVPEAK